MSSKETELAALRKKNTLTIKQKTAEESKARLKKISAKKFQTCFIFAIAAFEGVFGSDLWGHDLPEDTLTPEQIENRKKWEIVRKNILDKGHTQSRALCMEMDLHDIEFMGYRMNFGGHENG